MLTVTRASKWNNDIIRSSENGFVSKQGIRLRRRHSSSEESNSKYIYVGVDTESDAGYGGERILKTEKSFDSGMLRKLQSDLSL